MARMLHVPRIDFKTPEGQEERWKMLREKLDVYLDGALSSPDRTEVETAVMRDPAAGKLLAGMRSERALRTAAYQSYLPTEQESRLLAAQVMAEARHAPVGRIGVFIRRGLAVAAGLAILAGAFMAGQNYAPAKHVEVATDTKTVYDVLYIDSSGTYQQTELSSLEERNDFIAGLQQKGATIVAADYSLPGHM